MPSHSRLPDDRQVSVPTEVRLGLISQGGGKEHSGTGAQTRRLCHSHFRQVAVMFDGEVEQVDSPRKLYARPASQRVASFIGDMNFINEKCCEKNM